MEFKKGEENCVVDALSRIPLEESVVLPEADEAVCVVVSCVSRQYFLQETSKDKTTQHVIQWVSSACPPVRSLQTEVASFHRDRDELSVSEGLLLRSGRFVVPSALAAKLLEAAHDSHPGSSRTKQRLRELQWWPCMDRYIEEAVKTCFVYQGMDTSTRLVVPPLQPFRRAIR